MIDLRTRAGRREEILAHIREHGGFSAFWASENQLRAVVLTEMIDRGDIQTDISLGFPNTIATITTL